MSFSDRFNTIIGALLLPPESAEVLETRLAFCYNLDIKVALVHLFLVEMVPNCLKPSLRFYAICIFKQPNAGLLDDIGEIWGHSCVFGYISEGSQTPLTS